MNERSRVHLVALLQLAHAGEHGAAIAYRGHAASVRDPVEKAEITTIMLEELDHRARVRAMLHALGVSPDERQERKMHRIGRLIAAFCRVGGWYAPMYGAGRFERNNVGDYERAAHHALDAGYPQFVDDLIDMAEVEWEHASYFCSKSGGHWLWRLSPKWSPPPRPARPSAGREGDELIEQVTLGDLVAAG